MAFTTVQGKLPSHAAALRWPLVQLLVYAAVTSESALGRATKVVAIIDTDSVSGPARQLVALAKQLERNGVHLTIIAIQRLLADRSPFAQFLAASGVRYELAYERRSFDLQLLKNIRVVLQALRPDIVQTHSYKATAVAAYLRATGASWKWIGFWHGATAEDFKVKLYHMLDRKLIGNSDRIVIMAESQRALFRSTRSLVTLINNAVLPHSLGAVEDSTFLSALRRPLLAVIGRLSSEKGVDVFLESLALLRVHLRHFSALVIGDGPERAALEAQAKRLGLTEVHFLGARAGLRHFYEAIDVLVIPSRSEGLPNVLLEALGYGCAVVATSVGAIPTVLTSPAVGALVPPGSPTELAIAINDVVQCPPSRAVEERDHIVATFSLETRAAHHVAMYESLLAAH